MMRTTAVLTALVLSSCLVAREAAIRKEASRLVPGCLVDEPGKMTWREIDPYLFRADACGTALWCRERETVKCQTTKISTGDEVARQRAAELLKCAGALNSEHIEFGPNDPLHFHWWWDADEITGCGRAVWCGDRDDNPAHERVRVCEQTSDLDAAAAQLALETQCPPDQIQAQARQVFVRREWVMQRGQQAGEVKMQISWRLTGCGRPYVCVVSGGLAPSVVCKAALDSVAPTDAPTPPPAPPVGP